VAAQALEFAKSRGLKRVTISGGEPTVCKRLPEYVELAAEYADKVAINTNGWKYDRSFWIGLIRKGLTDVKVSIDSANPRIHDKLRGCPGLWVRAVRTMKTLQSIGTEDPDFEHSVGTVVSRHNLLDLLGLLQLAIRNGAFRWALNYPECDTMAVISPPEPQQAVFRRDVLPSMMAALSHELEESAVINEARRELGRLYDPGWRAPSLTSRGVYSEPGCKGTTCAKPGRFLLVKYDGSILACNGGEYTEDAAVGYVDGSSNGHVHLDKARLSHLMETPIPYCRYCPIPDKVVLLLRSSSVKRRHTSRALCCGKSPDGETHGRVSFAETSSDDFTS